MSVRIRGLDGGSVEVANRDIDQLTTNLHGELLTPHDEGYDSAREIWNGMIDKKPALIARCGGVADVAEVVDFARTNGVLLAVRGGGHNVAGTALCDGGLVVDLSRMRSVQVEPERRRAWVGGGCQWADVDRETQPFGLAVPNGIVSTTGVAGLTLGGGFGWLTRKFGLTSDSLRSAQVVTAEGEIVTASAEQAPDLLWGLRGAGSNFGVVTTFEFEAHPHGPQVMAGIVAHPRADARAVVEFYRDFTQDAPQEVSTLLALRMAPPAPFLPEEAHGKPIAAIAACYVGPVDKGRETLAPIKAFGEPLGDAIGPKPFTSFQSFLDSGNPYGRRYYWKSEYFSGIEDGLVDQMLAHTEDLPSQQSVMLFFHLGGKAAQFDDDFSAAAHRDAEYVLNISAAWDEASQKLRDRCVGWARDFHQAVLPYAHGGVYVNFLTEEEDETRINAAYGPKKIDRLLELKRKWDPHNLFRVNKNIPPDGRP